MSARSDGNKPYSNDPMDTRLEVIMPNPAEPKHDKDCQLGDNFKDCPACVESELHNAEPSAREVWPSFLDSKEFYDLMQVYRTCRTELQKEVNAAYDEVRFYIRDQRDAAFERATAKANWEEGIAKAQAAQFHEMKAALEAKEAECRMANAANDNAMKQLMEVRAKLALERTEGEDLSDTDRVSAIIDFKDGFNACFETLALDAGSFDREKAKSDIQEMAFFEFRQKLYEPSNFEIQIAAMQFDLMKARVGLAIQDRDSRTMALEDVQAERNQLLAAWRGCGHERDVLKDRIKALESELNGYKTAATLRDYCETTITVSSNPSDSECARDIFKNGG